MNGKNGSILSISFRIDESLVLIHEQVVFEKEVMVVIDYSYWKCVTRINMFRSV